MDDWDFDFGLVQTPEGKLTMGTRAITPPVSGVLPVTPKAGVPQGMTIDKLRSMYPGIGDDKLRSAYKQKFGEDIK